MSKTPIVGMISLLNAGIALGILAIFILVGWSLIQINGVIAGSFAYVSLSQILRRLIARHHRKAIRHCKRKEFEQAIPEFQKSASFFRDHNWIDRYRAITMLSVSGMSYREMAMTSLGFCYAQIGDGLNARRNYQQCLKEFPENGMAEAALKLLDAGADAGNAN